VARTVAHLHRRDDPLPDTCRAGDRQRPDAAGELAVQDQERDATEVVAVKMGHHHRVHLGRVQALLSHGDQARRPAVHQQRHAGATHLHACLEQPPPPKSGG
jgi:hypothetical protein